VFALRRLGGGRSTESNQPASNPRDFAEGVLACGFPLPLLDKDSECLILTKRDWR
jgi:hypothetical protein